jgi:hypothetical protein
MLVLRWLKENLKEYPVNEEDCLSVNVEQQQQQKQKEVSRRRIAKYRFEREEVK